MSFLETHYKKILVAICLFVLGWSAYKPHDYFTWVLEVAPAAIAFIVLFVTRKRFPLTPFLYCFIALHTIVLMIGAKYTYAKVPAFEWLKEWGVFERNNYDKVGHFMQGFVPALAIREVFIRLGVVAKKRWLPFIVVSVCLAMSAVYEFIEWFGAVTGGEATTDFLGTQGYVWDTQSDMLLCLIGATTAFLFLSRMHDQMLTKFLPNKGEASLVK